VGTEMLKTRVEAVDGVAVVSVEGEVDLVSSEQLRRALLDALQESPQVTIDLTGLTFIDSSGLSALVDAHRRARDAGGVLTLRNPTPMLRRLLDITRLESLLVIEPDPVASGDE
jgi:anti-sigma B factor antagonist